MELTVNGARLVADASGVVIWPERGCVIVADLHFEKGSAFARRGRLVPPYDTARTLDTLVAVLNRVEPERVICLGDSFHDRDAAGRVDADAAALIAELTGRCAWHWVVGNHDPSPPTCWGGTVAADLRLGPLVFRHEAAPGGAGQVTGHFHPVAAVATRARRLRSRCFVTDGVNLILPAFGAFTGGLNVLDPAVDRLFPRGFEVVVARDGGLYRFPRARLSPDAEAPAPDRRPARALRRPAGPRD